MVLRKALLTPSEVYDLIEKAPEEKGRLVAWEIGVRGMGQSILASMPILPPSLFL